MTSMRVAVIGAGLIGRQHIARLIASPRVGEVVVFDPMIDAAGPTPEALIGTRIVASVDEALEADGVIVATPNATHADLAIQALQADTPVLVEKPLADTVEAAERVAEAADTTGVPVLVGHHRRHSGALAAARRVVESGELGDLVAVTGSALFSKPEHYFTDAPWRTQPGGGPMLINLVHDLDALRFLAGEITTLRCVASNAARGFDVEDTAVLTLEFASGALGTFVVSDAAASHRSWEQTSGENPAYHRAEDEDCYHLVGRRGSLSVPTLRRSRAVGEPSWWGEFDRDAVPFATIDPLEAQLDHFLDVTGGATPLVTAHDGLQSLRLVAAAQQSAADGGIAIDIPAPTVTRARA